MRLRRKEEKKDNVLVRSTGAPRCPRTAVVDAGGTISSWEGCVAEWAGLTHRCIVDVLQVLENSALEFREASSRSCSRLQ